MKTGMGTIGLNTQNLRGLGFDFSSLLNTINQDTATASGIASNVQKTINTFNPPSTNPSGPTPTSTLPAIASPVSSASLSPISQPSKLSTGAKIGIGLGAAAVIGGVIYFVTRKKKHLGDLDTAKTAKGRIKQRAAVFAKLEEDHHIWPKDKDGVRRKKSKTKKGKK